MSDQTVYAEALIATVARAFYEDDAVCLIDVLIRDKFLRDDDMGSRLSLPAKQMRRTLQFLQEEQLVKCENVDDLSEGGSQATKFWYIDYNHAVNVIRLRIYLLRKKLEEAELRARSSSMYLCPGYKTKVCNGRYSETEAQQVVDAETGLFLCQECVNAHAANPDPPAKKTYTLQLVDNTKDLRLAMDHMRRVNVQLSAKVVGNQQLRAGIYDLLQKVRSKGKGPLTSNLPSENRDMGIGSKRLAGTGRTAGIKMKKLKEQLGENASNDKGSVRKYLGGTTRTEEGSDLTYLKNAMGQQVAFEVEKGGGARANLLATRGRRRTKLMDAAASRVGVELDIVAALTAQGKKNSKNDDDENDEDANQKKTLHASSLSFLRNNIGRDDYEDEEERAKRLRMEEEEGAGESDEDEECIAIDATDEFRELSEDERRAAFQLYYKKEMARQLAFLHPAAPEKKVFDVNGDSHNDEDDIAWDEG